MKSTGNERQDILKKIQSLFAIANPENGAFQGEIENAAKAIQVLMDKYAVTMAELYASETPEETAAHFNAKVCKTELKKIRSWHWALGRHIAELTHTKQYSTILTMNYNLDTRRTAKVSTMAFYGDEENAALAVEWFDDWVVRLSDMASQATKIHTQKVLDVYNTVTGENAKDLFRLKSFLIDPNDHPNVYTRCWLMGCLTEMANILLQETKNRSTETCTALAVVDDKLVVEYKKFAVGFRQVKVVSRDTFNAKAFIDGKEVGSKVKVGRKELS